jgi:hypothetical protein
VRHAVTGLKTTNRDEYFRNCKSIGPDQTKYNENPVDVLAKCKAGAGGGGGGKQVKVNSDTDLYENPEPLKPVYASNVAQPVSRQRRVFEDLTSRRPSRPLYWDDGEESGAEKPMARTVKNS